MSTYNSPVDVVAATLVRSSNINDLDAAVANAFALLPGESHLTRGTTNFAVDTGAVNAYLASLPYVPSGYVDGLRVTLRPINTNTGPSTINVNSLGVVSIKLTNGSDLSANDITSGAPIDLIYSSSTSAFHVAPNSANYAVQAAAIYDAFDDRYLGSKSANPTLDNDGAALLTGALYFNSTSNEMRVYTGSAWVIAYQSVDLRLNTLTSATGSLTLANANNPIAWNWTQTTASQNAFYIGETAASTGGAGSQILFRVGTLAASTADPLQVQARGVDAIRVSRTGAVTITALNGTAGSGTVGSAVSILAGAGAASNLGGDLTISSGAGGTSTANGTVNINVGTNNGTAANAGSFSSNAQKIALGGTISAAVAYQTSIGFNSTGQASVTTASGAVALGGSYASGSNSFSVAIGDNTSAYGALSSNCVAIGYRAKAGGLTSFAFGSNVTASGGGSVVIGANSSANTGNLGFAIGSYAISNATQSMAFGFDCTVSAQYAFAMGASSLSAHYGKLAYGSGQLAAQGDAQYGLRILRASTTGPAVVVMTTDGAAAGTTNQCIAATSQAMAFSGTLIGKQTGSANIAAYTITGTIVNNGGTLTMPTGTITLIGTDSIGLTTAPTLTADNTNKGLAVTSGNKTATNIRWVCQVTSAEITY